LRRIIFATVLLALLPPTISRAQGRIFQRGETGISGTFDLGAYRWYGSWEPTASTHVHLTIKGLVDLGLGQLGDMYRNSGGSYLLVRAVPLDPGVDGGIGIDGGILYDRYTWYRNNSGYQERNRELFLESSVRVFWRLKNERDSRMVFGLSGLFRFNRRQKTAPDGEVLFGTDRGAWGVSADLQSVRHGWLYLGARLEYAEDKMRYRPEWRLAAVGTVGFVIPLGGWGGDR